MRGARVLIVVVVLLVALAAVQVLRPVPDIRMQVTLPTSFVAQGPALDVPWPASGESALSIAGVGQVGTAGPASPQPIASVAKMMVAYLILTDHPLAAGEDGPSVTVTPADVTVYQQDLAGGQSVVPVVAGEALTERQLLEGLLLPSGNNLATLLAQWDSGTQAAFITKMNAEAKALGMTATTYADASGVSPATVSTASDQLKLAEVAMALPTFASIVAMPQGTLPVAGTVYNVNAFLGRSGIIGIKTGSTLEAGGCFVVAADITVGSQKVLALGSVLGQGGVQPLQAALTGGQSLIVAAGKLTTTVQPLHTGAAVATLSAPWAPSVTLSAPSAPSFIGWQGLAGTAAVVPAGALGRSLPAGTKVATLRLALGTQQAALPLVAGASIPPPPLLWRLTRH